MWMDDYDTFMAAQLVNRTEAGVATGMNGAVTSRTTGLRRGPGWRR